MNDLIAEFGHSTHLPFSVLAARLVLAVLLGAVIGYEREAQNRPAGLRTHILVCLASAIVAILAIEMVHAPAFADESIHIDPLRVIEAVTAGIAFLAAGTIIFARGEVHGLTTGAGMWLAGAVGLCCGLGYWHIGLMAAILTVVVLSAVHRIEKKIDISGKDAVAEPTKSRTERSREPSGDD